MLTGLVGKANPRNVKVQTPTATIGIRGTGFDVSCIAPCTTEKLEEDEEIDAEDEEELDEDSRGLTTHVWQGAVEMRSLQPGYPALMIGTGKTGSLRNPNQAPVYIDLPTVLRFSTPRPDSVQADMPRLFGPCATRYDNAVPAYGGNPGGTYGGNMANPYGYSPGAAGRAAGGPVGGMGGPAGGPAGGPLGGAIPGSMQSVASNIARGGTVGPDTSLSQMGLPDPDQGMRGMRSVEKLAGSLPKMQQLRAQAGRLPPPGTGGQQNRQLRDCE
jgi:hypothetical protein